MATILIFPLCTYCLYFQTLFSEHHYLQMAIQFLFFNWLMINVFCSMYLLSSTPHQQLNFLLYNRGLHFTNKWPPELILVSILFLVLSSLTQHGCVRPHSCSQSFPWEHGSQLFSHRKRGMCVCVCVCVRVCVWMSMWAWFGIKTSQETLP